LLPKPQNPVLIRIKMRGLRNQKLIFNKFEVQH